MRMCRYSAHVKNFLIPLWKSYPFSNFLKNFNALKRPIPLGEGEG